MGLSQRQLDDFGVALNEARLVGVQIDAERRAGRLTFEVLSLPADDSTPPRDTRVLVELHPLGRVVVSLRHGLWNDPDAEVEAFALDQLGTVLASFGPQPVYGWEFLDAPAEKGFDRWADRLSLDQRWDPDGLAHTLDLFQEGRRGHLDLRFWFDEMRIYSPERTAIPFDAFTAAGRRWWDGLHAGDPRTTGLGIVPLRPDTPNG